MSKNYDFEIEFFESVLKQDKKDPVIIEILAAFYTKMGRIDDGLRMDRKLLRLQPDNPFAYYNLACSLALKHRWTDSVNALRQAIQKGYDDFKWMQQDPDLSKLRQRPIFIKMLRELNISQ